MTIVMDGSLRHPPGSAVRGSVHVSTQHRRRRHDADAVAACRRPSPVKTAETRLLCLLQHSAQNGEAIIDGGVRNGSGTTADHSAKLVTHDRVFGAQMLRAPAKT